MSIHNVLFFVCMCVYVITLLVNLDTFLTPAVINVVGQAKISTEGGGGDKKLKVHINLKLIHSKSR